MHRTVVVAITLVIVSVGWVAPAFGSRATDKVVDPTACVVYSSGAPVEVLIDGEQVAWLEAGSDTTYVNNGPVTVQVRLYLQRDNVEEGTYDFDCNDGSTTIPPPVSDEACVPVLFKVDPPVSGEYDGVQVTFDLNGEGEPGAVTVEGEISAVSVKGGPTYKTYRTPPFVGLTAQVNPSSGKPFAISHVLVCGEQGGPTSTTSTTIASPTTTTSFSPTSTVPTSVPSTTSTSSTVPPSTTTVPPSTSTTTPEEGGTPPSTTTTSRPPQSGPPTTPTSVPAPTSTVPPPPSLVPDRPSTSRPPSGIGDGVMPSTTEVPPTEGELPYTGDYIGLALVLAAVFFVVGYALVLFTAPAPREHRLSVADAFREAQAELEAEEGDEDGT